MVVGALVVCLENTLLVCYLNDSCGLNCDLSVINLELRKYIVFLLYTDAVYLRVFF